MNWLKRTIGLESDDITQGGGLYVRRWRFLGRHVRMHEFHSDDLRTPHDHPWTWFVAVALTGGAVEDLWRNDGGDAVDMEPRRRRKVRRFVPRFYGANATHRIHGVKAPMRTLLISGRDRKRWGFWVDIRHADGMRRWVPHYAWKEFQEETSDGNTTIK